MEEVINTSAESLAEDKLRAREQWGADPCGAVHGQEFEFGSREFFDEVERHRYTEYAPWMREVMGFDKFPGAKLLEIGCGMGSDLLQFARGGAIVTGADLTPRSVETSKHRFKIYDQPGTFVLTDGERLPFADASFDVVYSNGVLHHTPDTEGAVREVHRVLRPGGTAKVMLYYRNSLNYWAEMFLRRGVLTGDLLRGKTMGDVMSRWVEYNEHGGRPLVKVYSKHQSRELFKDFSDVHLDIRQITRPELRFLSPLVSDKMLERIGNRWGWNVIITARK